MAKGTRCTHTKQAGPFRKQATPFILIILGGICGWLMTRAHIPIGLQLVILMTLTASVIALMARGDNLPVQALLPKQTESETPFSNATSSSLNLDFAEQALAKSHTCQLKLLCDSLNLTSSAIIIHSQTPGHYHLHASHSNNPTAINQEMATEAGILLSLKDDRSEISGHPSSQNFQGLPYYRTGTSVGGFMVISLKGIDQHHPLKTSGFLCVDRKEQTPWTQTEKSMLRQAAHKISTDLYVTEQLAEANHDKKAIKQICLALQDLNTVLNLQEAFEVTQTTVTSFTSATLVAITLKDNQQHSVVSAVGPDAEKLKDLTILNDPCLVNQAIGLRRTMTPKGGQHPPMTLFTSPSPIDTYQSLLIIPLISDDQPIGTLIAGGTTPKLFSKDQQTLLEVVAGQIATRIDLAKTHEKIYHMATIDGLTGLVNHRTFQNGLRKMLDRASRQKTKVALILCDIDHFKGINDNYGHPFGDEVLRQVARVLKDAVRTVDLAARYGGEEFTLVLENADQTGGVNLAERVRKEIEGLRFSHANKEIRITISFGVSCYPTLARDQSALISQADQALYRSKEAGRNQTQCYT